MYGLTMFKSALDEIRLKSEFFPLPALIRKELETMQITQSAQAKAQRKKYQKCSKCFCGSLVLVVHKDGFREMKDCECLLKYQAEVKSNS